MFCVTIDTRYVLLLLVLVFFLFLGDHGSGDFGGLQTDNGFIYTSGHYRTLIESHQRQPSACGFEDRK